MGKRIPDQSLKVDRSAYPTIPKRSDSSKNGHWQLSRADGTRFRTFASREDAEAGLAVARENNQLCYIGKSNTLPDRERHIMEYWRKR